MFVGTIHAFCLELLKSEAPKYLKYEVLNEVQQGLFVDRHSKQSGLTTSTDLAGTALKRYRDTKHYIGALAILREAELEDAKLKDCSVVDGLAAYRQLLDDRSYLDYSSILEAAVEVLTTDDDLRTRLAERIKYVIVDEYQDVNPVQEAIAWSLHELGARICVVGDDDQTIYQWRGSDVENILTFNKRYPGVDQIPLEENFRSSDGIVETARAFIEQNTSRLAKAMKPTGAQTHEQGGSTVHLCDLAVAARCGLPAGRCRARPVVVRHGCAAPKREVERGADHLCPTGRGHPIRRYRNDEPVRYRRG
jgi:DNA helicase-2/ATP-dependent DNA helicase PcrA